MTRRWNWDNARASSITLVDGVRVGHTTDTTSMTGCTAVVCDHDAVAGVDVCGGATASHEIELLDPCGLVSTIQGVMLSGGSAMGLSSAGGAVEYFRTQGRGFETEQGAVPIVPAAALFDLGIGHPDSYPNHQDGLAACESASAAFARGNVGAGTGAVVGKVNGHQAATKGGLGSAGWETEDGLKVGAVAAVNAFGDVVDPDSGMIIAGARHRDGRWLDTSCAMIDGDSLVTRFGSNTTLCVIATNAKLSKAQATVVARIAQTGISRSISPCHTQYDGDMVFALSLGQTEFDLNRIGVLASRVIEAAILDAVLSASPLGGVLSAGQSDPENQS